jgi:hypothetical protein
MEDAIGVFLLWGMGSSGTVKALKKYHLDRTLPLVKILFEM